MDLTIIRVKRSLDIEPLQQIGLASKKLKLDSSSGVYVVATVNSKDEPLGRLLQNVVTKFKLKKAERRLQSLRSIPRQDQYKHKRTANGDSAELQAKSAAESRYKIVSKARGITQLDSETENYLNKSEQLSLTFSSNKEDSQDKGETLISNDKIHSIGDQKGTSGSGDAPTADASLCIASNVEGDITANQRTSKQGMDIEVLDVDHSSVNAAAEEDVICMNGVPLEKTYVYDIFLARLPKGHSVDHIDDWVDPDDHLVSTLEDLDHEDDSDDSNDENNYRNDYPEGDDESEGDCSLDSDEEHYVHHATTSSGQLWDDELAHRMSNFTINDVEDHMHGGSSKKAVYYQGMRVPDHVSVVGPNQDSADSDVGSYGLNDTDEEDHP